MTNPTPVQPRFRRIAAAALAGFAICHLPFATAAAPAAAVIAIQPTRVADLVLLGRGFDAGLRQGMVCRIIRGADAIGEVLLVDLRPTCSAALILNLAAKQSIRAGDLASVKIQKT